MKIYLVKTNGNNMVLFTDGETAKCFDCAPTGMYEGIDIYAENAPEKLAQLFAADGALSDFDDIYTETAVNWSDIEEDDEIERVYLGAQGE